MSSEETYSDLPAMPVSGQMIWERLDVGGLVKAPLSLNLDALGRFPQSKAVLDFRCHDGWVAPAQEWEGVRVSAVLDRAEADHDAKYVNFRCGDFIRTLTLAEAAAPDTLLAVQLNGRPVPYENGGPCRLVAGNRMGPAHVKWVQRIDVTNDEPDC
jgi:DMSO/TMAO reductase YedYZ molybdopterin-dependent catalytic subunit